MPVDAEYNPQKSKHPASAVLLLLAGALLGVGALTAWSWQFGWPQPLRAGPGWQSAGLDHSPYLLLGRLPRVSPSGQKVDDVAAERYLDRAWAALPHDGEEGGFWMKWDAHARLVAEKNGFAGIATELGNAIAVTAVDRAAISVARNFWEMAWLGRDCGALRNLATVHADGSGKQLDADLARPWLQELLGADCEGEGQPLKTNTSATRIYQSELTVTAPAMPSVSAYDLLHIDGAHATRVDSNPQLDLAREADFREALKRADGLLFGKSGETSRSEAEAWLKRAIAIQLGRSELLWALTQLGTLYLAEDAEPQRFARARFVWEAAAAFGDTVAMCFLQQLHEGPLADSGGARIWAERARTAGGCPQSGQ